MSFLAFLLAAVVRSSSPNAHTGFRSHTMIGLGAYLALARREA
jgi:hypothetical protein